jgi:acyl-coenzyme A synthetase/AMP-(fatty) acid ligase
VLDALEYRGATCYVGVPTTYRRMEEAGAAHRDLTGVRLWISAADVMPPDLASRFQAYGRAQHPLPLPAFFVEGYGMVESGGAAMMRVTLPGRRPGADPGFVGAPLPGWRARVVDDAGRAVGARTTGELELQGPGVLCAYLGDAAATADTVRDGWLRTGDLAFRDRLGLVHFAGRSKEVIKSGGYSVFPAEVETALRAHPDVADAVVFGLPDRDKGAVPAAAIVPAPGAHPDADAVAAWARERLARYKAPRRVYVVSRADLPEGPTRKVLRAELAARFGD